MAEDPKNPFSGPLNARNMGARGRKGASGGGGTRYKNLPPPGATLSYGNFARDFRRSVKQSLARDQALTKGIGKALETSVKRNRKTESRFDKLEDTLNKMSKRRTGGRF